MKKLLAIILVLVMILPLAVACDDSGDSSDTTEGTEGTTEGTTEGAEETIVEVEKLAGKTPKELYNATIIALSQKSQYEIYLSDTSKIYLIANDPAVATNAQTYCVNNGEAYIKYVDETNKVAEFWFKDSMFYISRDGEKQRTKMSAEVFASNYLVNPASTIFPFDEADFEGKKFTCEGDEYFLKLDISKEDYMKYFSYDISDPATYTMCFDSNGTIKWARIDAVAPASNGVKIYLENVSEYRKLDSAEIGRASCRERVSPRV